MQQGEVTDAEAVARLTALRQRLEANRTERARAEATKEQAEGSLSALLGEHGVATVEELAQKAADARASALEMLAQAEAAVG